MSFLRRHPGGAFAVLNLMATGVFLSICVSFNLPPEKANALRVPLVFSPLLTAVLLTLLAEGGEGLRRLFSRIFVWRVGVQWHALALMLFPLLAVVALAIRYALWGVPPHDPDTTPWSLRLGMLVPLFLVPGLAEEPGWRGYLQPHLQQRWGALAATLVTGVTWSLWHAQSVVVDPERYSGTSYPWFAFFTIGASVLIGWIVNNARGSILLAMMAHFSANVVFSYFSMGAPGGADLRIWKVYAFVVWGAAILIALTYDRETLTDLRLVRRRDV